MNSNEHTNRLIILTLSLIMLMGLMDSSVLNTSLPQIAKSLHDNPVDLKVALTSYLLSLGIFIPISGWVADRFGVRRTLKIAVVIFLIGSIGCGFVTNLSMLVVFRIIQGVGGSFMMPISRLVVLRVFGKGGIVKAMSKIAPLGIIGTAIGPVIGGALTTYVSWRLIFFINVPFGIFAIYMVHRIFPSLRQPLKVPFDAIGFISFGAGMAVLLFVVDILVEPSFSWHSKLIYFAIALACLLFYIWHARRIKFPMLNMGIFKNHTFRLSVIGSILSRFAIGGVPFLIPLMLQASYGMTAFQAGFAILAAAIGMAAVKLVVRPLLDKFGYKRSLLANTILITLCFYAWSALTLHMNYPVLLATLFVYGLIVSNQFTCMNSLVYINLEPEEHSQGTSIYSTALQLSMCFGIAIAALILVLMIGSQNLHQHLPIVDFRYLFLIVTVFPWLAFICFLRLSKDAGKLDD